MKTKLIELLSKYFAIIRDDTVSNNAKKGQWRLLSLPSLFDSLGPAS